MDNKIVGARREEKMNKRAELGEQTMFVIFLFFMVIIGGGIAIGTLLFVSSDFNFKVSEAQLMNYHLRECVEKGVLDDFLEGREKLDSEEKIDFIYSECGLDREVMGTNHYIKICPKISDPLECIESGDYLVSNGDFQACELNIETKFLGCSEISLKRNNIDYSIISASKQEIRRNI